MREVRVREICLLPAAYCKPPTAYRQPPSACRNRRSKTQRRDLLCIQLPSAICPTRHPLGELLARGDSRSRVMVPAPSPDPTAFPTTTTAPPSTRGGLRPRTSRSILQVVIIRQRRDLIRWQNHPAAATPHRPCAREDRPAPFPGTHPPTPPPPPEHAAATRYPSHRTANPFPRNRPDNRTPTHSLTALREQRQAYKIPSPSVAPAPHGTATVAAPDDSWW